ncbi:MAG: DUF547 domain-containing protein [Alphaproteobacteria bacterium]|nr:DUF547 domain-containing protein [Alphaproteobacteria bacterium]
MASARAARRPRRLSLALPPLLAAFLIVAQATALAAPKAELWARWLAHDPDSLTVIDHSPWQRFLDRYLLRPADGVHRIRYGAIDADSHKKLKAYLAALAAIAPRGLNRDQQRAYWINMYNALTADVILDHYPVASIRDIGISPGWFARGPWGAKLIRVEGIAVSLDDIEHRILRPIWKDARIHYAVNCAALSCPGLLETAFTAENADRLLTLGGRRYVNSRHGVRFEGGALYVSSLYFWYGADFGGTDAAIIAHLARFAEPRLAARLARQRSLRDGGYDWSLNDAP